MTVFSGRATGSALQALDLAEVRRALTVLADPDVGIEFLALPSARHVILPGRDLDGLCKAAERLGDERGLHYTLNPIPPELPHNAHAEDVLKRRWFLVDVDPIKDEGHDKDNATEVEKDCASRLADQCFVWLQKQDWPAPVVIDSGNGFHLLYRIDQPNTLEVRAILKRVLCRLKDEVKGEGAEIDVSVHNADRHGRLPGSWARKGPSTEERPHRPVRMISVPHAIEVVPLAMLERTAELPTSETPPGPSVFGGKASGNGSKAAYWRRALDGEVARVALAPVGGRNEALVRAAFNLATLVAIGIGTRNEVEAVLTMIAQRVGLEDREIASTIRSGFEAGLKRPRQFKDVAVQPDRPAADNVPKDELIILRASQVQARRVEWLWPGRIPLGKLTTFAGQGGIGKTFVLCDVTARVTTANSWPDLTAGMSRPGQVLFISGEDDVDDTLKPRLIELRADLDRVCFLRSEALDAFTLADLKTLDTALEQMGSGVAFVVIDPPTAYLGEVNDHKNAELRRLLSPLKNWAARHRLAVVFNTHVTKPAQIKMEAMMRVMGSVAWVNAVRAAHCFAADPEDRDRRLFCPMKSNLSKMRQALSYRIKSVVGDEDLATVEWLGEVDVTADEAMSKTKRKRSVEAAAWLATFFPTAEPVLSKPIGDKMEKETTLSRNALLEAKEEMGIKARMIYDDNGSKAWWWEWSDVARATWLGKQQSESHG